MGFWLSLLLLMWSFSAIYLAFPNLFYGTAEFLGAHDLGPGQTDPIDVTIDWMVRLHFGRTFGNGVKVLWIVLGGWRPRRCLSRGRSCGGTASCDG